MNSRRSDKTKRPTLIPRPVNAGWQVVYTGFILIMLCFFIMLTSFASLQQSKITRFVRAFSNAVTVYSGGKSLEKGQTMLNTDVEMVSKEDAIAKLFEQVRRVGKQAGLEQVRLEQTGRGVVMSLSEKLLFASGEARFTDRAYPRLEKIGRLVQGVSVPIEIEGHTDNVPIQSSAFASNWELSTARAVTVLRYLVTEQNVDPLRVTAVGFSEFQTVAPNDTPANRAKNRRVDIVFKTQ